jgi:hypothetical protein
MKIRKIGKFLSLFSILGICLAPFGIYIVERYLKDKFIINHESIHWKQQMEMGILLFYIWYGLEWFIKLFIYGKRAYYHLSFEIEAYYNEDNLDYLKTRKHYAWIKYILK